MRSLICTAEILLCGTKFSHVVGSAHQSRMKKNLTHTYKRKSKENVNKSKQIPGEKLPHLAQGFPQVFRTWEALQNLTGEGGGTELIHGGSMGGLRWRS